MTEEIKLTNKGYNKLLFDKRIELGLSTKEASKKLHISRVLLHLIENGYVTLTKRLKNKFITTYELDESFFDNDLSYPVILKDDEVPISKEFIRKLSRNKIYKIVCIVCSVLFLGMALTGVGLNISTKNNIPSFYDSNVLDVREAVISDESARIVNPVTGEVKYELNNREEFLTRDTIVYFDVFESEQKIPYTNFSGITKTEVILPFVDPTELQTVNIQYTSILSQVGNFYVVDFNTKLRTVASINAVRKGDSFEYKAIWYVDANGNKTHVEKKDPSRALLTNLFEENISYYENALTKLFDNHPTLSLAGISYEDFSNSFRNGNQNLKSRSILNGCLLIFGIVFCCLAFALAILSFFKRDPVLETKDLKDKEEIEGLVVEKEFTRNDAKLSKNWKIFPILPGSLLRLASIVMIFIYSIGTYLAFASIMAADIKGSLVIAASNQNLSAFLVIAFFLLLFVKNDMVQQRKDYFLTNYFYFFSGLALYLLVLALSKISVVDSTIRGNIELIILNIIPGNFLWGFLAFNMIVFLLFYTPISYKDDPKKLFRYRLLALIPYAYLIISMILGLLDTFLGLNMPFWLSFLFFTKSTDLIVFLVLFTSFCFLYKRYVYKKYSKEDALLYERGNKYYFVKNIAASIIVALIGLFELMFLLFDPKNAAGFGKDVLIFITIPFMLLYHPHHGKRNSKVDWVITIFYGAANVVGIALIILSILGFIIRYI